MHVTYTALSASLMYLRLHLSIILSHGCPFVPRRSPLNAIPQRRPLQRDPELERCRGRQTHRHELPLHRRDLVDLLGHNIHMHLDICPPERCRIPVYMASEVYRTPRADAMGAPCAGADGHFCVQAMERREKYQAPDEQSWFRDRLRRT